MNGTNPILTPKTASNTVGTVSRNLKEACRTEKKVRRKRHRVFKSLKEDEIVNAVILGQVDSQIIAN